MDTTIQPGNFRVAIFTATKNSDGSAATLDSPVSVTFDNTAVAVYASVDGLTGDFVALAEGTSNFTATALSGGISATVTGVVAVAKAVDNSFTLAVSFGDEQVTPAS